MSKRIQQGKLQVADSLHRLLEQDILPGTGITATHFWNELERLLEDFTQRNRDLLATRDELQARIDAWHRDHPGSDYDRDAYLDFLQEIGYLLPEAEDFSITTANVDAEVASVAGPQLVVPVMNARYALNAANARWGSLYDALYGTDVIPDDGGAERGTGYNPVRGDRVIAYARHFLDSSAPLERGSHAKAQAYCVVDQQLLVNLADGTTVELASPGQLRGYCGATAAPSAILLCHNDLHIEIQIDHDSAIGKADAAGIKDLLLESAITTIQDILDSAAQQATANRPFVQVAPARPSRSSRR